MSSLQIFEQTKNNILKYLQQAEKLALKINNNKIAEDLKITYTTLYREQFEVMIVGEFSNGKSTFLNALLREELLPSSNVPTTELISKIHYNNEPSYSVYFDNGKSKTLTKEEFLDYVAEDKHQIDGKKFNVVQKIKDHFGKATHLDIGYPTELCENNIVLIDSPGTNDMDERRVMITDTYIPKSDAAIFLLNATKIFTDSEKAFLLRILDADIQKIFFVINFKDRIKSPEEYDEIEQVVRQNLPPGIENPKIHFISALHALNHYKREKGIEVPVSESRRAARKKNKSLSIEETGLLEFESHLMNFLSIESGTEKLRKPTERGVHLLEQLLEEDIIFEQQTLNHSIQNIEEHVQNIENQLKMVESDFQKSSNRITQTLESKSDTIVRWYVKEMNDIAIVAENVMNEGIKVGHDPENIKSDIELATANIEKNLTQELEYRIQQMINEVMSDENARLEVQIGNLTKDVLNLSSNYEQWGGRIYRQEEKTYDAAGGASVGLGLVGLATVVFTGGIAGWGMIGAGVAGASASAILSRESDASMYNRLKVQVKERYKGSISKRTKEITKALKSMGDNLKKQYNDTIVNKIDQERKKTKMLLDNQSLEVDVQQQKIYQLKQLQMVCESLIGYIEEAFTNYIEQKEVKEIDRVKVKQ